MYFSLTLLSLLLIFIYCQENSLSQQQQGQYKDIKAEILKDYSDSPIHNEIVPANPILFPRKQYEPLPRIFGLNHLITITDPEFGLPVGTKVSLERIEDALDYDISKTIFDFMEWYTPSKFNSLPKDVQVVLIHVNFDIGHLQFRQLSRVIGNMLQEKWVKVSEKLQESVWYDIVPTNRRLRLIALQNKATNNKLN